MPAERGRFIFKGIAKSLLRPEEFTMEDYSCIYCLYYQGKKKPCPLTQCCCEDERKEAIKREQSNATKRVTIKE